MAAPVVRRVDDDDDPALLARVRRAWSEEDHGIVDDDEFDTNFATWWAAEAGRRLTWIATDDDEPVGMLNVAEFVRMPKPGRHIGRWGYVSNLFVLASRRNAGLGSRMLDAAIGEARRRDYVRLVLHPSERARTLYERAGFRRADELMMLSFG